MEISAVCGSEEMRDLDFAGVLREVQWNGRTVTETKERKGIQLHGNVPVMMSRPPDRTEFKLKGGDDDKRGKYIEGEISIAWDSPKPPVGKEDSSPPPTQDQKNQKD